MLKRCRALTAVVLAVASILMSSCARKEVGKTTFDLQGASWPIFRGDSNLSGVAAGSVPDRPVRLWTFKTGSWIAASPVIGDGRVYIGSGDGKIQALNLVDGNKVWEIQAGGDIEASALFLDGALFVGNLDGDFFCLDAGTGRIRWKQKCEGPIHGSANWAPRPGKAAPGILVGCYDNKLYCFDAAGGALLWSYETGNYINGAPATDGRSVVFGGCDELLHVLSIETGLQLAEIPAGSYIPGSAALVDSRAYVGHYDDKLLCIDLVSKSIAWEYRDRDHPGAFFSSPAIGSDRVLIGSRDGYLHCVDRLTGKKIWAFRTGDDVDGSPVIAGSRAVFGSADGRLYLLDLKDGREVWSYEIGAPLSGSPAVAGGMIVIGADDGRVYAFGGSPSK